MREMKDSGIEWIGEIPKEWEVVKAKYCIDIHNGSDPKTEGDIPVYGSGTGSFKTCGEYKKGPTVLLGRKGSIGIPHYIEDLYWNVDTAFDVTVKSNISLKYYYYLSACFDYDYYISQTTLPSMTQTNYENMVISLPDINEQHAIADFLDSKCSEIDALTADIETQIDTLEQYKRSVITEAVTKGLNPDAVMKDSGIEYVGEIPASWDVKPIRAVFEEVTTKNKQGEVKTALKFTYGNIVRKTDFDADEDSYVADTILNYTIVEPGTIMLNGLNLNFDFVTQRVGLVKEKGVITSAYMAIKPIDISYMSPEYATYLFKSYDNCKALHNMGGGVRKILNFQEFQHYYVIIPSIAEQHAIADYLDTKCSEIDSIISDKRTQLDTLTEYKKSLIYEYVTGKKEVPAS